MINFQFSFVIRASLKTFGTDDIKVNDNDINLDAKQIVFNLLL